MQNTICVWKGERGHFCTICFGKLSFSGFFAKKNENTAKKGVSVSTRENPKLLFFLKRVFLEGVHAKNVFKFWYSVHVWLGVVGCGVCVCVCFFLCSVFLVFL